MEGTTSLSLLREKRQWLLRSGNGSSGNSYRFRKHLLKQTAAVQHDALHCTRTCLGDCHAR